MMLKIFLFTVISVSTLGITINNTHELQVFDTYKDSEVISELLLNEIENENPNILVLDSVIIEDDFVQPANLPDYYTINDVLFDKAKLLELYKNMYEVEIIEDTFNVTEEGSVSFAEADNNRSRDYDVLGTLTFHYSEIFFLVDISDGEPVEMRSERCFLFFCSNKGKPSYVSYRMGAHVVDQDNVLGLLEANFSDEIFSTIPISRVSYFNTSRFSNNSDITYLDNKVDAISISDLDSTYVDTINGTNVPLDLFYVKIVRTVMEQNCNGFRLYLYVNNGSDNPNDYTGDPTYIRDSILYYHLDTSGSYNTPSFWYNPQVDGLNCGLTFDW